VSSVRVATLNIWGRRGAWAERRSVLADGFGELRPDLVAFQEAVVTHGYDQVADILGPDFHVAHQKYREAGRQDGTEDGQGVSIASRWPLGEVQEVDLNVTPRTGTSPTRLSSRRSSRRSPLGRCCSFTTCPAGS
jgi:endonuclease/exonuclease/phosphatase family metal-dependent hydrolase